MESIFDWSVILSIVGVLVIVTNIVVQVLKKLTWDKLPTNILAVLIAMALTLAAFFAYCEIKGVAIGGHQHHHPGAQKAHLGQAAHQHPGGAHRHGPDPGGIFRLL